MKNTMSVSVPASSSRGVRCTASTEAPTHSSMRCDDLQRKQLKADADPAVGSRAGAPAAVHVILAFDCASNILSNRIVFASLYSLVVDDHISEVVGRRLLPNLPA